MRYDAIIVGARCAGAATGIHLTRAGARVLVLDGAKLPSDSVLSTHHVQPPGMDALDELGIGDRMRKEAPPSRTVLVHADGVELRSTLPEGRAGHCVRRFKLDAWLQETLTAAGAELRDRSPVVELVRDGDRVAGVVVETPAGRESIRADLVIGADGPHSTIAKLTGVEEYLGFDMTRGWYWAYWPAPPCWKYDPDRFHQALAYEGDELRMVMQTDSDLLVIGAGPRTEVAATWGRDHRERYLAHLRDSAVTGPLVENNAPIGKIIGLVKARCFYRRPIGPGFALVGDAGNFKDYVTGHGITDALLGAKLLSQAVVDGREAAFTRYWRERDATTLPLYFDAMFRGEVGANHAFLRMILERAGRSPELSARPALMQDRKLSPFALVPKPTLLRWTLGALLRGRFDVVRAFVREARRAGTSQREIATRRKLLADARATIAATPPRWPPALSLQAISEASG